MQRRRPTTGAPSTQFRWALNAMNLVPTRHLDRLDNHVAVTATPTSNPPGPLQSSSAWDVARLRHGSNITARDGTVPGQLDIRRRLLFQSGAGFRPGCPSWLVPTPTNIHWRITRPQQVGLAKGGRPEGIDTRIPSRLTGDTRTGDEPSRVRTRRMSLLTRGLGRCRQDIRSAPTIPG